MNFCFEKRLKKNWEEKYNRSIFHKIWPNPPWIKLYVTIDQGWTIIFENSGESFKKFKLIKACCPKRNIIPLIKNNKRHKKIHDFVGPVCETTDKFLSVKGFYHLEEKEYVAISDVGAYGMSLSSNYNLRPKACEILIENNLSKLILKRQKLSNII